MTQSDQERLLRCPSSCSDPVGSFMPSTESAPRDMLNSVLDAIDDVAFTVGRDGQVTGWNRRAETVLGWTRAEMLGRSVAGMIASDRREWNELLARALRGEVAHGRQQHVSPSGAVVDLRARVTPLRDRDALVGALVVSSRVRQECRIIEEAAQGCDLAVVLDAIPVPIFFKDVEGRYLGCNTAFEKYVGKSRHDIIGKAVTDLAPPDLAAVYQAADRALLLSRGIQVYEASVIANDGERRDVVFHKAVFYRDGEPGGVVGTLLDITQQKRNETALRESEAKFRAAFRDAAAGILLVDPERRIIECNRAFGAMLGHAEEELHGTALIDLVHPDEHDHCRAMLRQFAEGRCDSYRADRRYRRKDGTYAHTVVHVSAVRGPAGEYRRCIAIVEDVSSKKMLETQLAVTERLASMGTLAAGVAHEINNPLAFILANLSFVAEELSLSEPRPDELLAALRETREGALRVREIVRDLKTFSRPADAPAQVVDLRAILEMSLKLARNEIRHRAHLTVELGPVPPVAANPHRLEQVFVNLLVNAAHAIQDGPAEQNQISVSTGTAPDGRALVEITDSGCGICGDVLPRIFDPFFTTKPVGFGTGLGLSICHGIVTGLGGEILVDSRLGHGSTFRVLLPATGDAPIVFATQPVVRANATPARARILVVDDEPLVGAAVKRVLASHDVVTVVSAREALAALENDPRFDLIICDLMMPEMTGIHLHERVGTFAPDLQSRMVFFTGGAFTAQAREFLDKVPNARLDKPFDPEALRAFVRDALSSDGGVTSAAVAS